MPRQPALRLLPRKRKGPIRAAEHGHLDQVRITQQRKQEYMSEEFFETTAAKDRTGLLEANRENVAVAYTQALGNNVAAPVVFVLDLRYDKAAMLAQACIGVKGKIQKMIDDCAEKKVIPTVIAALPRNTAVKKMDSAIPDSGEILSSTIPRGHFRVMVLAFGGRSHSAYPEPRTPRVDAY
jgi:hypothetical protein